mmetsp:Transcript_63655/g.141969  ORF Transcript_63655/g.141969 Transcript_63655/m.141969 type:complete len:134 (-) Transcript_63655:137-538(-)
MINVLEHVASAFEVLESIYNATKPGGTVILWEPAYNRSWPGWQSTGQELIVDESLPISKHHRSPDWSNLTVRNTIRSRAFDEIAHPIRVDPAVFRLFAARFDHFHFSMGRGRRGDISCTLIGRKRAPSPRPWY